MRLSTKYSTSLPSEAQALRTFIWVAYLVRGWSSVQTMAALAVEPMAALTVECAYAPCRFNLLIGWGGIGMSE